jgi:ABC-2 type transport system permease protein
MRARWQRLRALAGKDLLETRRDRLALLFTVAMPLLFTAFFGLLFAGGSDRVPVAVWNADRGAQAGQLLTALTHSGVVKLQNAATQGAAEQAVADDKVAAALEIPAGFSAAIDSGAALRLTVVGIAGSSGAQTVQTAVRSAAGQLAAADGAALAALAATASSDSALGQARQAAADSLAHPVARARVVQAGPAAGQTPQGFVLSSPGMVVNFIMFSILTAGTAVVVERRNFTLLRLMTTRLRRTELIAGKVLSMFILTFVQQVILLGVGQLLFGVDYLRDPAALLLMMVALSLVASTLGLLLAALLATEQALVATTVLVSMSVSALSGAWFPLQVTGPAFRFVGHLLPTAWILDGLRGIVLRGFGVADVLSAFAFALAWAVALFALAVWRFRLSA